jgi:N-methylhydantoinase A/oxoprolinase/acetone carboxylase beta subunit
VKRGIDPRQFALVPLGGGGPVHATALARELGMRRIVVPLHPGVLSADGLLAAPVEHEASLAFNASLDSVSKEDLARAFGNLDAQCAELMRIEGLAPGSVVAHYYADVCYVGQSYHLEVPVSMSGETVAQVRRDFYAAHDRIYGHSVDGRVKFVNLRAVHQAMPHGRTGARPYPGDDGEAGKGTRRIHTGGRTAFVDARIYERSRIKPGTTFDGPAIVEQADTTTVVEAGWRAVVDPGGCLVLSALATGP